MSFQITFDATDPAALATFWAEALDYIVQPPPEGFASWDAFADQFDIPVEDRDKYSAVVDPGDSGPRVLFQKVPEAKTAKNRVHLDVRVTDRGMSATEQRALIDARAAELEALGATRGADHSEQGSVWTVMHDPEGNEFCLT